MNTERWAGRCLHEHLLRIIAIYRPIDIFVTGHGSAWQDVLGPDGRIRDEKRGKYLVDHLLQVHRAIEAGVPVKGYFVWSFVDNFEWAYGYRPMFGLVYTEYTSQERHIKDSGFLYRASSLLMGWMCEAAFHCRRKNGRDFGLSRA